MPKAPADTIDAKGDEDSNEASGIVSGQKVRAVDWQSCYKLLASSRPWCCGCSRWAGEMGWSARIRGDWKVWTMDLYHTCSCPEGISTPQAVHQALRCFVGMLLLMGYGEKDANDKPQTMITQQWSLLLCALCASLYTPIVIRFATIVCMVIHRYVCGNPFAMWMLMSIAMLKLIRHVYNKTHKMNYT